MPSYELLAAYCRTEYRVELPNRKFSIRLGSCCSELDELLAETGRSEWTIITAENPRSRQLSESENAGRRNQLRQRLCETGDWEFFPSVAICPRSEWPPEHGQLVVGIAEDDALLLGREFDQHAILWGRVGHRASLRVTAPEDWRVAFDGGPGTDDELVRKVCDELTAAQLT